MFVFLQKKVCPYGSSCYRKKEGHFEEYDHNEETSSTVQSNTTATSKEKKSKKEVKVSSSILNTRLCVRMLVIIVVMNITLEFETQV